jgi:hypothetical protein
MGKRIQKKRLKDTQRFLGSTTPQGGGSLGVLSALGNLLNKGISKTLNAIPDSDSNARPGFPGERHAILKLKNGLPGIANYMGPGTHITERIERGDPPRTLSDKTAQAHDLRYQSAKVPNDIRDADRTMLKALKRIKKNNSDSLTNILQGDRLIRLKMALLPKQAFGDLKNAAARKMTPLMTQKLKQLTQQGFGSEEPYDELDEGPEDPVAELRAKMLSLA